MASKNQIRKSKKYKSALGTCLSDGTSHNICDKKALSTARKSSGGKRRFVCPKGARSRKTKGGRSVCYRKGRRVKKVQRRR